MPSATIADTPAFPQPSTQVDTPSSLLTGDATDLIATLFQPKFPSAELVDQAAALLPRVHAAVAARHDLLDEGPRTYIRVGPGMIRVGHKDYARAERTAERQQQHARINADLLAAYLEEEGEFPEAPNPTRVISEWSWKSRRYMLETLASLDFTPMYSDRSRAPGMLTLTYPGCWLRVAPSGRAVKRHMKALRKRYERAYGEPMRCVWKLEFQCRFDPKTREVKVCTCDHCGDRDDGRAPHLHMLIVAPRKLIDGKYFYTWIRETWADVVAHPDPQQYKNHLGAGTRADLAEGMRSSDPGRLAVYFGKHGTFAAKEYQHIVPQAWQENPEDGPGRFWGYWGLEKATKSVQVDPKPGQLAGQLLRRWSAAQNVTRQASAPRVKGGRVIPKYPDVIGIAGMQLIASRDAPKYRKVRRKAKRMRNNRGFVLLNDGPAMVTEMARYLDLRFSEPDPYRLLDPARLPT